MTSSNPEFVEKPLKNDRKALYKRLRADMPNSTSIVIADESLNLE